MVDISPVRSTGIGSWPGLEIADAIKIAFDESPDLPYLPELPARGPWAQLVGRGTAFLAGLAVDLQPAGWRLTDASNRDHRLAVSTLRSDLDHFEEHAQGYAGPVKIAVAGPWTLAASMERPRGDRVLADHGARRELGQSLAEGIAELLLELRRRLPDISWLVQLDEPLLPAVLAGSVPTASGFSKHRAVDLPELSGAITSVIARLNAGVDTAVWVHCCAADVPVDLLHRAGAAGLFLDPELLPGAGWDAIATLLDSGGRLGLGALPTTPPARLPGTAAVGPAADRVARRVIGRLRELRLDPEVWGRLMITPACGLAGASRDQAVAALRVVRRAAAIVTEQLAD